VDPSAEARLLAIDDPDYSAAILEAKSSALTARLVVQVEGALVTHSTFLRYDRPSGKALWALAEPVHRVVIPHLLNRAATGRAGR
jgi:hypothetical protein